MSEDRSRRSPDSPGAYNGPDRRKGEDRRHRGGETDTRAGGTLLAFADRLRSRYQFEEQEPDILEIWISFTLGEQLFALPVDHVSEVIRVEKISAVPGAPFPVLGITNVRGRVLPVVDLRAGLGLGLGDTTSQSRILVVEVQDRWIGMLVDGAHRVLKIVVKDIVEAEVDSLAVDQGFVHGVYPLERGDVVLLAPKSLDRISRKA